MFNIESKTRKFLLPNATYGSDTLILFVNESCIFNSFYIKIGILNLISQKLEWYGKPPQFIFSNKVIYSQDLKSFIGLTGNNISNFQYDSQTNIIDENIKIIVISPNSTNGNLSVQAFLPEKLDGLRLVIGHLLLPFMMLLVEWLNHRNRSNVCI